MIFFNGREYANRNSARAMEWKLQNREKWYASRTKSREKWPGKRAARSAIDRAIAAGRMMPANTQRCFDCKTWAKMYDHFLGYNLKYKYAVQAVCRICSIKRDKKKNRR